MSDLGKLLRAGDPLAQRPEMEPHEAQAMRRLVLAAVHGGAGRVSRWPGPLVLGATIAAAVVGGVAVGRILPDASAPTPGLSSDAADTAASRRQLQFASPGGTRIIWVFDPEFNP